MRLTLALATAFLVAPSVVAVDIPLEKQISAVVEIRAKTPAGISAGTGFIVDANGTVATCFHVISGASEVAVRLTSGETFNDIRVVGADQKRDIALIKFAGFGLPFIPLADSDSLHIGDTVFAVGHPNGLENTVTRGIVSALRTVEGMKVIQTDSAASPGNSGGPLLNDKGQSIGVVSFKISGEGLNFAIPINYVRGLLGMQTPMTLAQFNSSQTAEEKSLFTSGDQGLTGKWRSLESNTIKVLREDGNYLYGESLSRDEKESLASIDMKRQSDGSVVGRVKGRVNCQYWCLACFPARWIQNSCNIEDQIVFTKIEKMRIEGYVIASKAPEPSDKAFGRFCKTCGTSIPKTKQTFVWVRMQ